MQIQLIEGEFKSSDALDLITQMIHIKIRFHENKISKGETEEDSKAKESKIIKLQKDLFEVRNNINSATKKIKLNAIINIESK